MFANSFEPRRPCRFLHNFPTATHASDFLPQIPTQYLRGNFVLLQKLLSEFCVHHQAGLDFQYVLISQTGVIYQLEDKQDSTYSFHRIDATININYNIASNNFVWDKHIYSYGGYGFWKLNGHLRAFNFLDKEWDIAPADNEIISNGYNWYSNKEGRVYVPFQSIVNAGIIGPESISGIKNYDSYYLDLASKKWIKLGSLNTNTRKLIIDNINNNLFTLDSGYIFTNQDVAYYYNKLSCMVPC